MPAAWGMLLILDCLRSAVLGEELQDQLLDGLHGYDVQDPHIHTDMPRDDGVEVMCTITLSPLDAATCGSGSTRWASPSS